MTTFNQRVCQDPNSIIWKLLYQRDISQVVPPNDIAGHYVDILDKISTMTPNQRLIYGGFNGYEEIVKNALENGAESRVYDDIRNTISTLNPTERLIYGAKHGYEGLVKNALDNGADIHANNDEALYWAAWNGHTETVKVLLDRGQIFMLGMIPRFVRQQGMDIPKQSNYYSNMARIFVLWMMPRSVMQ